MRSFAGVADALTCLHQARDYCDGLPTPYVCPLVKAWCNLPGESDSSRVIRYARSVIPQRILQLTAFTAAKTYHFVGGFIMGVETGNPYALYTTARCQVELLAALYRPVSIIRSSLTSEPSAIKYALSIERSFGSYTATGRSITTSFPRIAVTLRRRPMMQRKIGRRLIS